MFQENRIFAVRILHYILLRYKIKSEICGHYMSILGVSANASIADRAPRVYL